MGYIVLIVSFNLYVCWDACRLKFQPLAIFEAIFACGEIWGQKLQI
jgi:hypothetical protein